MSKEIKSLADNFAKNASTMEGVESAIVIIVEEGEDGSEVMAAAIGNSREATCALIRCALLTTMAALDDAVPDGHPAGVRDVLPLVLLCLSEVTSSMLMHEVSGKKDAIREAAAIVKNLQK